MLVLHLTFCSFFLFFPMFVVQVFRQMGQGADHHRNGDDHNQWANISPQFHCVWKADWHFYTELQDFLRQHQWPQSVFRLLQKCVLDSSFFSSRVCFLQFQISHWSVTTPYKTKCKGEAEMPSLHLNGMEVFQLFWHQILKVLLS